jgi:hypothetical protein
MRSLFRIKAGITASAFRQAGGAASHDVWALSLWLGESDRADHTKGLAIIVLICFN